MKKTLTILVLALCVSMVGHAQEYKPFQLYFGLGFASPSGGGVGVLIDLEPSYRVNDQIAVGLRFESAAMAKSLTPDIDAKISAVGSYTVNARYYLGESSFRPYVGAGLGLYALGTVEADISTGGASAATVDAGTKFGFYPRVGFDFGHLNVNLDYNIVGKSDDIKNSYMGIRLGFFLFGGKK